MIKRAIKEYLLITFGAVLAGSTIYFFMMPSNLVIGSTSALAMVLGNLIPIPVSVIALIINVFLLVLAFLLLGREFGAKTVYTSILLPVVLGIWENVFPNFQSLTQDPFLDMMCHLLLINMAIALLFSCNASSGGLDIVAKLMNKYLKMDLGTAISISGVIVALTSVFYYDSKTVILSILGTYFSGIFVDWFISGLNIKRRVCIISDQLDNIVDFILHTLHSGATLYEGTGAYDNTPRKEVVTIVDKHEYRKLMDYVKRIDSKAFVTVYSVKEMRYQPKTKKIKK
jgi:uncharacterized membrane-anchored protein YitT (DUF2179 family)